MGRKQALKIILIGIVILIIGLIIAAIPLTWRSMQDIANDWEATVDEGYYASYNEGDRATVSGKVTAEYQITLQDDPDFYAMGYRYCYELDHVWDECPLSKKDLADPDDEVDLNLKLEVMNVDGYDYWVWTVTGRADRGPFYIASMIFILIGGVLVGAGIVKREVSRPRMKIQSTPYGTVPTRTLAPSRSMETSVLDRKRTCTHCGESIPLVEIKCPECGKSKFDT